MITYVSITCILKLQSLFHSCVAFQYMYLNVIICLFPLFYRKNGEKIIRISKEKWLDVYGKVKRSVCRAFFNFNWADYLK